MKKLLLKLILKLGLGPGQKTVARQLRQPHGKMGTAVGNRMNQGNGPLYEWVLGIMQIQPNQNLLEIGYGNGNFFSKVFAREANLQLSGLDFSKDMYAEAMLNCAGDVNAGRLSLHYGSSDKMPFADNSFDKVFCTNVVYFWENPQAHLAEVYRVLKPGGQFYAGIRTKKTMLMMPFTKFGFAIRSNNEWKEVIEQSPLQFSTMPVVDEPEMTMNGKTFIPQSGCIVAQKPL